MIIQQKLVTNYRVALLCLAPASRHRLSVHCNVCQSSG